MGSIQGAGSQPEAEGPTPTSRGAVSLLPAERPPTWGDPGVHMPRHPPVASCSLQRTVTLRCVSAQSTPKRPLTIIKNAHLPFIATTAPARCPFGSRYGQPRIRLRLRRLLPCPRCNERSLRAAHLRSRPQECSKGGWGAGQNQAMPGSVADLRRSD